MRIRRLEWLFALVSLSNVAMANAAVDERVNLLPTEQELARRDACPGGGVLRYAGDPPTESGRLVEIRTATDVFVPVIRALDFTPDSPTFGRALVIQ